MKCNINWCEEKRPHIPHLNPKKSGHNKNGEPFLEEGYRTVRWGHILHICPGHDSNVLRRGDAGQPDYVVWGYYHNES